MRTLYRVLNEMPDLRAAYTEMFANKSDHWRKFITGCHVLRDKDLATWIIMVLSKKENQPISFKRKINSLDYIPESGLAARLKEGERMFKRTKTQADKPSARPQENPSLIS